MQLGLLTQKKKKHIQLICGKKDYHGLLANFRIILYLKTVLTTRYGFGDRLMEFLTYNSRYQNQSKQEPGSIWNDASQMLQ